MTDTITISRAEYDRLRSAAEDLADLQAYDSATAALASGDDELVPAVFADRILNGEPPLHVLREWRGITGVELARRSGVNRVQILDIEAGRRGGSVATMKKLADALGVSLDDLV